MPREWMTYACSVEGLSAFKNISDVGRTPVTGVFVHRSGALLKLRGALAVGSDCRKYITVLVEHGKSAESRRRRMMLRFGLTQREIEVLHLVRESKTNRGIAIILGSSARTIGKHLENILLKVGVENRAAAVDAVFGKTA